MIAHLSQLSFLGPPRHDLGNLHHFNSLIIQSSINGDTITRKTFLLDTRSPTLRPLEAEVKPGISPE